MPNWSPRSARIVRVASAMLAAAGLLLVFARLNRAATARAYFWVEQGLIEHWPSALGKSAIERFASLKSVPTLCRIGVLGPVRIQVEPRVSLLLDPRDWLSVTVLRTGEWQPEIWNALSPVLSEGSIFLDVGAHIGYFSMKAAVRVGQTGRVVAFEPNPETLPLLRNNVSANQAENVIVEPIACTDREQTLTLYAGPISNTGMSSLSSQNVPLDGAPRRYTVRGRTIDDVVRELNLARVDAIKVDVEGAEVHVLRGAVNTLKQFHPKLVVEVIGEQLAAFQNTAEDVTAVMRGAGYNQSRPLGPLATDWEWTVQ